MQGSARLTCDFEAVCHRLGAAHHRQHDATLASQRPVALAHGGAHHLAVADPEGAGSLLAALVHSNLRAGDARRVVGRAEGPAGTNALRRRAVRAWREAGGLTRVMAPSSCVRSPLTVLSASTRPVTAISSGASDTSCRSSAPP